MATNDFLPFATGGGANVVTQAAYAALAALSTGYQSGVANSAQLNKTWRQSSIAAAVLAQFITDITGQNAVDDGTTATLLANLKSALHTATAGAAVGTDTGAANAAVVNYTPPVAALVDGMVLWFKAAAANTGAATLNVNGLGAQPVVGGNHSALQGGEIIANGKCQVVWNATLSSFVLIECTGGALQVAAGSQSGHAPNLGQFLASMGTNGYIKIPMMVAGALQTVIVQWGSFGTVANTADQTVTLPIAFPNNFFTVVAGTDYTPGSGTVTYVSATPNGSKTSFIVRSSGAASTRWVAFGN